MLVHDVSDVLLESAKLCKYSAFEAGASVLFGFFVLSWFILRLVIFPFWIIWSIRSVDYCCSENTNLTSVPLSN